MSFLQNNLYKFKFSVLQFKYINVNLNWTRAVKDNTDFLLMNFGFKIVLMAPSKAKAVLRLEFESR